MIRCNLAVLLAERNLKITQVANDTGISRTTLTSLANNYSQGIQMDTLNKLCIYLRVTPEQLLAFLPFDIESQVNPTGTGFILYLDVTEKQKTKTLEIAVDVYVENINSNSNAIEIALSLYSEEDNEDMVINNQSFIRLFKLLPPAFIKDLESKIVAQILASMEGEVLFLGINWPDEVM